MSELKVGDSVLLEYTLRKFNYASAMREDQETEFLEDAKPTKKTGRGQIYEIQGKTAFVRMGNLRVPHPLKDLKLDVLAKPKRTKTQGGAAMAGPEDYRRFRTETSVTRNKGSQKRVEKVLAEAAEASKKKTKANEE